MFNYFDYFNKGFIFGAITDKYKPYINYTWEMLPSAKVKNSGTSGVDLQLYSGNPLDFQATQGIQVNKSFTLSGNAISLFLGFDTDSIAITQTLAEFDNLKVSIVNATLKVTINAVEHNVATIALNTYYQTEIVINSNNLTVKLNGTQTYSASCTALNTTILKSLGANDGLASGRFDGQFDYFIVYNGLTTFSLPNTFYNAMKNDVNTLFCTDFGGNSRYIADDKNKVVGGELSQTVLHERVFVFGDCIATNLGDYIYNCYSGTRYGYSKYNLYKEDYSNNTGSLVNYLVVGKYYIIEADVEVISGSVDVYLVGFATSEKKENYPVGKHRYTVISSANSIYSPSLLFVNDEIGGISEWVVSNMSIKPITSVYPVINYSATQRTNFTQESKGLQDLTRLFDSNGFFLDNTDYLNCNGKGKAAVIEPSRTSKVTIQTNPTILSGNILSGGVTLTTAGLTVGIDNDIVLDNQAISSNIDIGVGYKGKVTIYKEDLL